MSTTYYNHQALTLIKSLISGISIISTDYYNHQALTLIKSLISGISIMSTTYYNHQALTLIKSLISGIYIMSIAYTQPLESQVSLKFLISGTSLVSTADNASTGISDISQVPHPRVSPTCPLLTTTTGYLRYLYQVPHLRYLHHVQCLPHPLGILGISIKSLISGISILSTAYYIYWGSQVSLSSPSSGSQVSPLCPLQALTFIKSLISSISIISTTYYNPPPPPSRPSALLRLTLIMSTTCTVQAG